MKIAIAGKGGAGKTALAALLARALADRGWRVLAADLDTNPGLAVSLGLPLADAPLPDEAVEQRPGAPYGWALVPHLTPAEVVERWAVPVRERIVFLGLGNIADVEKSVRRYTTAIRTAVEGFEAPGWAVVADLEAGTTTPFEHYARFASAALVATTAMPASMLAARRILAMLEADGVPALVVATKVRGLEDLRAVSRGVGPVDASIPFDDDLRAAERHGSLLGLARDACGPVAVEILAERLEAAHEARARRERVRGS